MLVMTPSENKLKGGDFVIRDTDPATVFTPESWNEEQMMMAQAMTEFIEQEYQPLGIMGVAELDAEKDRDFIVGMLERAGEMGFCGMSIEEKYGGIDLDFNTSLLVGEALAKGLSFGTTLGAQTSIGSLPIVFYGTDAQKEKYLPGIASGELKAAYALTEPGSGSDANSGRTKAVPTPDGKTYILNGQKMWITNGGFADVFIVFAKIEDDKNLSAFIVERDFGGVTTGKEEKKMGIKASSTVQVFFSDTPVPAENLLSERGAGFKIALNILNTGRIKLAAGAVGGAKMAMEQGIPYAIERKQFDTPIAEFGAIKHKIGEMTEQTFAMESAVFRTGYNIDQKFNEFVKAGLTPNEAKVKSVREYAVECALLKVQGSESVSYVVDEVLQIFGGMGYAVETGVEMGYRDARILRIFEGTNEINRMLSLAELTKRALKTKEVDLQGAGKKVPMHLLKEMLPFRPKSGDAAQDRILKNIKMAFLLLSGGAGRRLGKKMVDEQEIVMNLSDILAEVFLTESSLLRVRKLRKAGNQDAKRQAAIEKMLELRCYKAVKKVRAAGDLIIDAYAEGSHRRMMRWFLRTLTPYYNVNPKALRRDIADYMISRNGKWV